MAKQKQVTVSTEGLGINLGNPLAKNTLVKVCNPFCKPCSQSHPKIESLLKECYDIKVRIIFNAPDVETLSHFKVVTHFLAAADEGNQKKVRQMLNSWYKSVKKNYTAFASKYPATESIKDQKEKVTAMYNWVQQERIRVTPTFFLNGYQIPDTYDIEDLRYFLLK